MKSSSEAELINTLRQHASEIAKAGHDGWGNTMTWAADVLELRAATPSSPAPYVVLEMDNVEFQCLENMLRDYRTEARKLGGPSGVENVFIERVLNEGQRALNAASIIEAELGGK